MKDRVKTIRKNAGLTMAQFGDKIGMKKASVSLIESGRNNPSDSSIKMICIEFGVNEEWLRTGEGEPYKKLTKKQKIADFFADVMKDDDESVRVQTIEMFAEFSEDDWSFLASIYRRIPK